MMGMTAARVVRVVAAGAALLCVGLACGAAAVAADDEAVRLVMRIAYPVLFLCAAACWLVAAITPSPWRSSLAAAFTVVPALLRSLDYVWHWATEGTSRPGSFIVAISVWALVAWFAGALAWGLSVITRGGDHHAGRFRSD